MGTVRRFLWHTRRGRMFTVFILGAAAVAAVTARVAIRSVLMQERDSVPATADSPGPSPSPWPVPTPCLTGEARPGDECGWLFWADLDGDGERDQLALIVSLSPGDDFYHAEAAELRARLASGPESGIAIEVNPLAGFPQVLPEQVQATEADHPGVLDLDGDGRDEVMLSLFQSATGRLFVRLFVWEADGLREVSAAGESPHSARREALVYGDAEWNDFEPFEFIVGGSAGFGGGLRCADVDSDAERELILRFYRYASDPDFYQVTEVAYDLDRTEAIERSTETDRVPVESVDDSFRNITCDG